MWHEPFAKRLPSSKHEYIWRYWRTREASTRTAASRRENGATPWGVVRTLLWFLRLLWWRLLSRLLSGFQDWSRCVKRCPPVFVRCLMISNEATDGWELCPTIAIGRSVMQVRMINREIQWCQAVIGWIGTQISDIESQYLEEEANVEAQTLALPGWIIANRINLFGSALCQKIATLQVGIGVEESPEGFELFCSSCEHASATLGRLHYRPTVVHSVCLGNLSTSSMRKQSKQIFLWWMWPLVQEVFKSDQQMRSCLRIGKTRSTQLN